MAVHSLEHSAGDAHGLVARMWGPRATIALWSVFLWLVAAGVAAISHGPQQWNASAQWPPLVALVVLTAGFAATEVFVVHLRIRADAHTFSLVEMPLAFGLFFASPAVLILAELLGGCAALVIHRKQSPLKVFFNAAVFASTTGIAVAVFRYLADDVSTLTQASLLQGGLALIVEALLSVCFVFVVICVSTGSWKLSDLRSDLLFGLVTALFTSSLGIIAVVVIDAQPGVAWLLAIPTAGTYLANWAYTTQRRRHEGLDFLYQSTQLLHQSSELEAAMVDLLRHTCSTFNAEAAELVYLPESGEDPVCVRVVGGNQVMSLQSLNVGHQVLMSLLTTREASILRRGVDGVGDDFLNLSGYKDAIVAPLLGEHRVVGALIIADRLSEVVGFDATDARLAETLANHTTTALENGRLEQSLEQLRVMEGRLTFQALHDPLTGLGNRTLFRTELSKAIAEPHHAKGAVLFIDLDDFKTVNDSFGHAAGDELLVEVATRLKACLDDSDTIARLGGDEFAILLVGVNDVRGARDTAELILNRLDEPVRVAERWLSIRASVGIALIEPGTDPEALMRNADTAMYTAKAQGKHRVVSFESEMLESNIHRFNLNADLQRALVRQELTVHFQPIVDIATNRVLAAEALVRWNHPDFGLLGPDHFLDVAEQTGLIVDIDRYVLNASCAWLVDLDKEQAALVPTVNVNMSPRSLRQPDIVNLVVDVLRAHKLTPNRLGIEITENLMSEHADEAIDTLRQMKDVGLSLALDDFGTGYSSLSYLQALPVDSVKIAKSFVDDLETEASQRAFTVAIVALGEALDKFVIAEGVERAEQMELLRKLGCDAAQGFFLGQPMAPAAFHDWLATHPIREPDLLLAPVGLTDRNHP